MDILIGFELFEPKSNQTFDFSFRKTKNLGTVIENQKPIEGPSQFLILESELWVLESKIDFIIFYEFLFFKIYSTKTNDPIPLCTSLQGPASARPR